MTKHCAIHIGTGCNEILVTEQLLNGSLLKGVVDVQGLKGVLYSHLTINKLVKEEMVHGQVAISSNINSNLQTMSSGEQKKALLRHLFAANPGFIVVENAFDNLDTAAQESLLTALTNIAEHILIIQVINRKKDILPFINTVITVEKNKVAGLQSLAEFLAGEQAVKTAGFSGSIPPPLVAFQMPDTALIELKNVSVSFEEKKVLNKISWTVKAGEFWQLTGPNGSGKSTMLNMITGDSPKGYGKELYLFGKKKGSGETVWDIKQKIGYLSLQLTQFFPRLDSAERMILSGFFDSVGLYTIPSEQQVSTAHEWLRLIGLYDRRNEPFCFLPLGKQRMVLVARAMVKHPPLLILDEPTVGLDDTAIELFTALINTIAVEKTTTVVYVSHRPEAGLAAMHIFELVPGENGSTGKVLQRD